MNVPQKAYLNAEGSVPDNLGSAYFALDEIHRAIKRHESALAISREIGDRRGAGTANGNLGLAHLNLNQTASAIGYLEQHLAITREIGDRMGESRALGNLGLAYLALDKARKAIELFEQALAVARDIGDRQSEGEYTGHSQATLSQKVLRNGVCLSQGWHNGYFFLYSFKTALRDQRPGHLLVGRIA